MKKRFLPLLATLLAAVPAHAQTLVDRYSFTNGVTDSVGGRNGTLEGAATVSNGALQLPGGSHLSAYASLPIGSVITGNTNLTVEAWFTSTASVEFAKVFMFGANTSNYLCYTPVHSNGNGLLEFAQGGSGVYVTSNSTPTLNVEHQLAAVYNGTAQTLSYYLDGTLLGTTSEPKGPSSINPAPNNYLGASFFNDPDFAGSIDELRLFSGALTGAEVTQEFQAGPNTVTVVPEPSTWAAVAAGAGLLGLTLRRRARLC